MNYHTFHEARANFEAQRKEQAQLAGLALEMKTMQRDFIKAAGELKTALVKLEAAKAAPVPAKPTTAAPETKAAPSARKAAPKAKPIASKVTPKRPASPQSIAIGNLEQRLAVIATKISALSKRLKSQH